MSFQGRGVLAVALFSFQGRGVLAVALFSFQHADDADKTRITCVESALLSLRRFSGGLALRHAGGGVSKMQG